MLLLGYYCHIYILFDVIEMIMKVLFQETLLAKFTALEVINAFLGIYIVSVLIFMWYFGVIPSAFLYLTPFVGIVLLAYHIKISADVQKSVACSGSLLNLKFASSTGSTFILFLSSILCLIAGCFSSLTLAFVLSLLFVLNHALYISIDKNQIRSETQKKKYQSLLASA